MPRWVAFEERFIVAEGEGEILAALRYRMAPKQLLLGLLVTDPWAEERPLARALYPGAVALAPIVFSIAAFSGSAQFAVAAVLGAGGGVYAAFFAAVFLNARFGPMGAAIAPYLKGGPLRRALEGQTVVDTSWALASRGEGRFDREFMMGATLPQAAAWIGGTIIGALGGDLIGDPEKLGLDVIFPAFFLALLAGEFRNRRAVSAALVSAVLALALVPFAPPGVPVIAACAAALLGLRRTI